MRLETRKGWRLRLKAIRVRTRYWRPWTDYISEIIVAVRDLIQEGDIVTVSEKALSTASGLLIDESTVKPGSLARLLAGVWMRRVWGGPLGRLTRLRQATMDRLRNFPAREGAAHKQVALRCAGFLQALRHYSEGGMDGSNIPYSYVGLPLREPDVEASRIREALEDRTGKRLSVMIVDGDTTYTWRSLNLAPRRVKVPGVVHLGGFLTFVAGRTFGFRERPTPIALSGETMNPDWALTLANISHRVRGHGAGRTVWDMTEALGVGLTGVTWNMLNRIDHFPIVIIRTVPDESHHEASSLPTSA
jgi:F420-0:gamma-glutamyl ligase-like protein